MHQKVCGPDLKRKYLENPQLCRRSFAKSLIHSSPAERKDESSSSIPQRTSHVTANTPYLNVSSPQMVISNSIASTVLNDDDRSATDTDEITTVKTEHL